MWSMNRPLSWFKSIYGYEIDQLQNFVLKESMPHLIFTGKGCKEKGLIATLFANDMTRGNGNFKIIYASNPITKKERADAKSMSYVSKSKLGSSAGEHKLKNPFVTMRIRPFVEESSVDGKFRVMIIWDFDQLDQEQDAFRRLMEDYSENCRMILITDKIGKIIDPIISRCKTFFFPDVKDKVFDEKLMDLISDHYKLSQSSAQSLRNTSEKNFVKSLLIAQSSVEKYRTITQQTSQNLIRKKSLVNNIVRDIASKKYKNAISEAQRYIQYNYVTWNDFAEKFLKNIIKSYSEHKEDIILILAEFDGKYTEEDVGYYVSYFLTTLKERFET